MRENCNKFKFQIIGSEGAWGGALWRVWPVIEGKLYTFRNYWWDNSHSQNGSSSISIKHYGLDCIKAQDFYNISKNVNKPGFIKGNLYRGAAGDSGILDDEAGAILSESHVNKYNNRAYYHPAYCLGASENSTSYTYYLGYSRGCTRTVEYKLYARNADKPLDNIDGIFICPVGFAHGREARKILFQLYLDEKIINEKTVTITKHLQCFWLGACGEFFEITEDFKDSGLIMNQAMRGAENLYTGYVRRNFKKEIEIDSKVKFLKPFNLNSTSNLIKLRDGNSLLNVDFIKKQVLNFDYPGIDFGFK